MVKVRNAIPELDDGSPDVELWLERLFIRYPKLATKSVRRAAGVLSPINALGALELVDLISELNLDDQAVAAALVYREVRTGRLTTAELPSLLGEGATELLLAVNSLASASLLEMSNSRLQDHEHQSQVENIKRMLIAMVDDPRVAVVKLAERVIALRRAKMLAKTHRERIANEALAIFAPLAGRLGIGQLKWELEDLAFRYTHEDTYMEIAAKLNGKRSDRERQVRHLEDRIRGILHSHGVESEVVGRAKHIFSIYRKMQFKSVSFEQVYDVRAIRVIVPTFAECYASLGIIHNLWAHVPAEFDDYIGNPKENGYQSIHTAVTMDDGATLEVQIRTQDMHREAELGVCAHWSYKGEEGEGKSAIKMEWLRQVLEWHEELGGSENLSTLLQNRASDDRIYVSTPKGHVLDLPRQATALDFAYRVHTDVGHGCRGVLINGQTGSLDQTLQNSQQVEIIRGDESGPRREWLEKGLDFVKTDRARAKIVAYFRSLDTSVKRALGEDLFLQAAAMLGLAPLSGEGVVELEEALGCPAGKFYERLGDGQIGVFEVITILFEGRQPDGQPGLLDETEEKGRATCSIRARNRDGLLHDITQIVSQLELPITATTGKVVADTDEAVITIETKIFGWRQRLKLACHLRLIPGVIAVGP